MISQADRTEASSTLAYEELLEEENQEAARAAAKKAKKLRQKAKKQQQALQVDSPPQDPTPPPPGSAASESESALQSGLESSLAGLQLASSSSGVNGNSMAHATEPCVDAQPAPALTTPPQTPQMRPVHAQAALTPAQQADTVGLLEGTHGLPGPSSAAHPGCGSAASVSCIGAAPGPADGAQFLQNLLRCPLSKVSITPLVISAVKLIDVHVHVRATSYVCMSRHNRSLGLDSRSHRSRLCSCFALLIANPPTHSAVGSLLRVFSVTAGTNERAGDCCRRTHIREGGPGGVAAAQLHLPRHRGPPGPHTYCAQCPHQELDLRQ